MDRVNVDVVNVNDLAMDHVSRQAHLQWCKTRALAELEWAGNGAAWSSLVSDLGKHPDTRGHAGIDLGFRLLLAGYLRSGSEMRDFIQGFR